MVDRVKGPYPSTYTAQGKGWEGELIERRWKGDELIQIRQRAQKCATNATMHIVVPTPFMCVSVKVGFPDNAELASAYRCR